MLQLTNRKTEWFTLPQDPTGETKIQVRHLKPGEVADIEAKANQVTGKQYGESEFITEIDFKPHERAKAYVVAVVVDWKGFESAKGKPLKCNGPNIASVMKEFDWFGAFVEECREELSDSIDEELEDAEKN